jgi:TRAP-type C4-dicarboxylate transport system substrate-binding protein
MLRALCLYPILTAVLAALSPTHSQEVVLRFNRWVPPTHHTQTRIMEPWARQVSDATQGRVRIEFTPASLGAPPRQFDLAVEGIADVTFGNEDYTPARFQLTAVSQLPFLSDSAEALSVAFWRTHEKYFANANEHAGVKLLTQFVHGPGHVFTSSRPIAKLGDFSGLKLRTAGSVTADISKLLGAVPISAPATQAYELVSNGVVDGTYFHNDGLVSFRLERLLKHQTRFPGGLYNSSFFLVMNKAKWDRIAPADQRAIMAVSGESLARSAGKVWDDQDAIAAREMEKIGTAVTSASAQMIAETKAKLGELEQKWLAAAAAKKVDGAAALAFLRAEVAAYKAK